MRTLDEIKAATAGLNPDEQVELFRWWVETDTFKHRQLAALKQDIALGLEQLEMGKYKTYDDSNVMQLADEVGRYGRERWQSALKKDGVYQSASDFRVQAGFKSGKEIS